MHSASGVRGPTSSSHTHFTINAALWSGNKVISIAPAKMASPPDNCSVSATFTGLLQAMDEKTRLAQEHDRVKERVMLEQDNIVRAKLEAFGKAYDGKINQLTAEVTDLKTKLVSTMMGSVEEHIANHTQRERQILRQRRREPR